MMQDDTHESTHVNIGPAIFWSLALTTAALTAPLWFPLIVADFVAAGF